MYLCNCWLIYYCPYYKPKNQSIGLFPPKFYICWSVVVIYIYISYIICVIYYYICFNNISYIPTCWSFFIYTHIHVYDLSICPSYIYIWHPTILDSGAATFATLQRKTTQVTFAAPSCASPRLTSVVTKKEEFKTPVGWWLYRMRPPSY